MRTDGDIAHRLSDGIYDPRQLNDRLILGLKGTMSEFELGLLRQRAREACCEQRGAPRRFAMWGSAGGGFIRTDQGRDRKRHLIARCSRAVGEAYFTGSSNNWEVLVKLRSGSGKNCKSRCPKTKPGTAGTRGDVVWGLPLSSGRIRQMLNIPVLFAGAFAYGKTGARTVIEQGRAQQRSLALPETTG